MRKLIGLILFLVLLGYPLIPVYGAGITATGLDNISMGNFAAVTGTIAAADTGDTVPLRLRLVIYFTMSPTSGPDTVPLDQSDWGYSVSGGTVTVYPETDNITWKFFAIGLP